jgi:hypothetical protein
MSFADAHSEPDLFGDPQPDLFADHDTPAAGPRSYAPDPADVRAHLVEILERALQSESMPWDERKVRFYKKLVPQMSLWLPEEEAAQLCLAFETEIARLEAA